MKVKEIDIQFLCVKVIYTEFAVEDNYKTIEDTLVNIANTLQLNNEDVEELKSKALNGMNGGVTYTNYSVKKTWIIVFPCTTEAKRFQVINHEKRHAEDDILKLCNINDAETAGYLAGYLGMFLANNS